MKKLIITTTILSSLTLSPSFAKTQGNYLGADIINSSVNARGLEGTAPGYSNIYNIEGTNQLSLGINYKHAFNFKDFFIAPGVFFDYSNSTMKDSDQDDWNLNYRYGIKLDAGYDFTNKFSLYANIGAANNAYDVDWKSTSEKSSGSNMSGLIGFGAKYSISDKIDLGLSYEYSSFKMIDPNKSKATFDLETIRLGASYKF